MSHAVTAVLYQHKNEGNLTACAISFWVSYTCNPSLAMNMHNMHKHGNIRTPCSTKCSCSCNCSCDALFIEYLFPLISSQTEARSLIIKCQFELL